MYVKCDAKLIRKWCIPLWDTSYLHTTHNSAQNTRRDHYIIIFRRVWQNLFLFLISFWFLTISLQYTHTHTHIWMHIILHLNLCLVFSPPFNYNLFLSVWFTVILHNILHVMWLGWLTCACVYLKLVLLPCPMRQFTRPHPCKFIFIMSNLRKLVYLRINPSSLHSVPFHSFHALFFLSLSVSLISCWCWCCCSDWRQSRLLLFSYTFRFVFSI